MVYTERWCTRSSTYNTRRDDRHLPAVFPSLHTATTLTCPSQYRHRSYFPLSISPQASRSCLRKEGHTYIHTQQTSHSTRGQTKSSRYFYTEIVYFQKPRFPFQTRQSIHVRIQHNNNRHVVCVRAIFIARCDKLKYEICHSLFSRS